MTDEQYLDAVCCFFSKVDDDDWAPGVTCNDLLACAAAPLGRPLTGDEAAQLQSCIGGTMGSSCDCCTEVAPGGPSYFSCDGNLPCGDLSQFLSDSQEECNGGQPLTDDDLIELVCEFASQCNMTCPEVEDLIDEIAQFQCKSLSDQQIADLEACTGCSFDCGTPAGGWSCGDDFNCDRNCDGLTDWRDVQKYIDESDQYGNGGMGFSADEKIDLICEFLANCNPAGDLYANLIEEAENILGGDLTPGQQTELETCSGCSDFCDATDENQDKEDEGDEDDDCSSCDETGANRSDCNGVDLGYGDALESGSDIDMDLVGDDFNLGREYTSDPGYTNGCSTGNGWSNSAFRRVKFDDQNNVLRFLGNARSAISVSVPPAPATT